MKQNMLGYRKNLVKLLTGFFMIFPWITYLKIVEYNEAECRIFSSYDGTAADLFIYYKERILIGAAVFLICWFIGERLFPDKVDNQVPIFKGNNRGLFISMGIFAGMAIISTILSENKKNALWGSPTEGEGLFTLLSYLVIILAFYNYFANEYGMKMIKTGIQVVGVITVLASLVQYIYTQGETVSLSFYNASYYGGFVCLILPFLLSFFLRAQKMGQRILLGVVSVGMFFCVIASNSTTALYIALGEYLLVTILYLVKSTSKKQAMLKIGGIWGVTLLAVILLLVIDGGSIFSILRNSNSATDQIVEGRFEILDIQLEETSVTLQGEEKTLMISYEEGQLSLLGEEGQALDVNYENDIFSFVEPGYENITLEVLVNEEDATNILAKIRVDAGYKDTIDFYILRNGTFSGVGQNNQIVTDIGGADSPDLLKKYYGVFTGRGYAWANSLPILKKTIITGVGPGNFAFYFKQHDYLGMLQTHKSTKYIIDKPHSAYIQYGVNVGIVGMITFFAIFLLAWIKGVKGFTVHRGETDSFELQLGGIVSLAGFFIYSMINDSMITVTPIVCMITGLMLAIDYIEQRKGGK